MAFQFLSFLWFSGRHRQGFPWDHRSLNAGFDSGPCTGLTFLIVCSLLALSATRSEQSPPTSPFLCQVIPFHQQLCRESLRIVSSKCHFCFLRWSWIRAWKSRILLAILIGQVWTHVSHFIASVHVSLIITESGIARVKLSMDGLLKFSSEMLVEATWYDYLIIMSID